MRIPRGLSPNIEMVHIGRKLSFSVYAEEASNYLKNMRFFLHVNFLFDKPAHFLFMVVNIQVVRLPVFGVPVI